MGSDTNYGTAGNRLGHSFVSAEYPVFGTNRHGKYYTHK